MSSVQSILEPTRTQPSAPGNQPAPSCRICGGAGMPAFMAGEHRMYRCAACRTAFLHPVPSDEALTRFYDAYHRREDAGGRYDHADPRMQADFPAKLRHVRRTTGGTPDRLLDVGCGKGFFLKACAVAGIDAVGVDLSESGISYAREHLRVKAVCGHIHELKSYLGTFNAATFWATVEHLPDPIRTLRDIFDLLTPGGFLFCDTGIGDDWLDRLLPGVVQWYDPPQHLFVFSDRGIILAMQAAGFVVHSVDRCFERSSLRRAARLVRSGVLAAGLRFAAEAGRMRAGNFEFTRYPVGNLMSIVARRPA